jgi:hypothetical protein
MPQQAPQLRFATTRLASGPRVHYPEQGDPSGKPIVFLPAYTVKGTETRMRPVTCWFVWGDSSVR